MFKVRLMKMFGLAALAAVAAMAFVGASSASAEFNTTLCKELKGLVCPEKLQWKEGETIHLVQVEPGKLLNSIATVLCLTVLGNLKVLGASLANAPTPLLVDGSFTYKECGTNSTHTNCKEVNETEEGLFHILKTGEHEGIGTGLNGKAHVHCEKVLGFITIDCEYAAEGLKPELSGLEPPHVTLEKQPVKLIEGGGLCPEESKIDALLTPLVDTMGEEELPLSVYVAS